MNLPSNWYSLSLISFLLKNRNALWCKAFISAFMTSMSKLWNHTNLYTSQKLSNLSNVSGILIFKSLTCLFTHYRIFFSKYKFKQTIDFFRLIAFELQIELITFRQSICMNIVVRSWLCFHILIFSNSSSAVAGSIIFKASLPFLYSIIFFKFLQCSGRFTVEPTDSGMHSLCPCETFSFLFFFCFLHCRFSCTIKLPVNFVTYYTKNRGTFASAFLLVKSWDKEIQGGFAIGEDNEEWKVGRIMKLKRSQSAQ